MALRRPPTRIELKADDVDEYDKVRQEREVWLFVPRVPVRVWYRRRRFVGEGILGMRMS